MNPTTAKEGDEHHYIRSQFAQFKGFPRYQWPNESSSFEPPVVESNKKTASPRNKEDTYTATLTKGARHRGTPPSTGWHCG